MNIVIKVQPAWMPSFVAATDCITTSPDPRLSRG